VKFEIAPGFLCLCCILGWWDTVLLPAFLAAVFLHEVGHWIVLRRFRVPITGFRLSLSGALLQTEMLGYGQEFWCAAAGPAVGVLAAVICCRWVPKFAVLNILLAGVNLLPLYPLDGGRMLRAVLLCRMEPDGAAAVLRRTATAVCCILMVLSCWLTVERQAGIWPIFVALAILWRVGQPEIPQDT